MRFLGTSADSVHTVIGGDKQFWSQFYICNSDSLTWIGSNRRGSATVPKIQMNDDETCNRGTRNYCTASVWRACLKGNYNDWVL